MSHELSIDVLKGLVYTVVICLIALSLKLALTRPEKPLTGDSDFEEFYCDLCQSNLTVDFTRQEAEALYKKYAHYRLVLEEPERSKEV